jgi:cytochrome P450
MSRIYIVTDPSLAAAVQRASKSLSFMPLVPDITRRVLGLPSDITAQIRQNLEPEPGEPRGFLAEIHDEVYAFLGPGEKLNQLSLSAARGLAAQLDTYAGRLRAEGLADHGAEVDLLEWSRHFVTVGTAHFLYGDRNPLAADPSLEHDFWDFVHGLGPLLMDVAPALTARRAYLARERLVAGLRAYIEAGGHRDPSASPLARAHIGVAERFGWRAEETARSELSFLFAGIINTAVATFWVALRVFADKEGLLAPVRAELEAVLAVNEAREVAAGKARAGGVDKKDKGRRELSIEGVRTRCPTLAAVFRESLRVGSDNFSTRLVKNDTLLAGERWFLRAGSVVQISAGVIHADETIWGADAGSFNHRRFEKLSPSTAESKNGDGAKGAEKVKGEGGPPSSVHPAAFRSFGGGKTLCPGRHFATSEIMVFVAMMVLMFDIEAADGRGEIRVPVKNDRVMPVHILEPRAQDVPKVRVRLREGVMVSPVVPIP